MKHFLSNLLVSVIILFVFPAHAQENSEKEVQEKNNGQDPTRPLTRFDIRASYTDGIPIPGDDDAYNATFIGRVDKPMPIEDSGGWVFYYRADVPFSINDIPSGDNLDRDDEFGLGDWFNQFLLIAPPKPDYPLGIQTYAFGFQAILPTATEDHFGSGRFAVAPLVAWKWKLTDNIDFIPIFKYRHHVGGSVGSTDRAEVNRFEFKPQVNIKLPDDWFVTLYDTADITLQLSDDSIYKDEWNVPIDVMVGKSTDFCILSDKCVYSVNAVTNIVDDYDKNDSFVQFRYGMFF